ncbi:MAG: Isoaspartyl peptidase [Bacteroidia bacterium]|nr:Isoaspartyl peptidase [Bacteroidia bacterium]
MSNSTAQSQKFALAIHGGAGTILKESMTPELESAYKQKLKDALNAGYSVLKSGGSSLDAVEVAVKVLEDSPLFNAGKGSVFTAEGTNEMDASIMEGKTLKAGSVAGVTTIKNPISAARAVMEKSPHVMMTGKGAEKFAAEQKLEIVSPEYFFDSLRYKQWQKIKETEKIQLDHSEDRGDVKPSFDVEFNPNPDSKFGTVGAVALDINGNLAAATSTGGMTNKKFGRIGDSPIIGAGCYANNKTCAVSCTGHGEFFIRSVVAYDISALMEYKNLMLQQAAETVIDKKLTELGGTGGVIAVDAQGNIAMPFNTPGMYRGVVKENGEVEVSIYK